MPFFWSTNASLIGFLDGISHFHRITFCSDFDLDCGTFGLRFFWVLNWSTSPLAHIIIMSEFLINLDYPLPTPPIPPTTPFLPANFHLPTPLYSFPLLNGRLLVEIADSSLSKTAHYMFCPSLFIRGYVP